MEFFYYSNINYRGKAKSFKFGLKMNQFENVSISKRSDFTQSENDLFSENENDLISGRNENDPFSAPIYKEKKGKRSNFTFKLSVVCRAAFLLYLYYNIKKK